MTSNLAGWCIIWPIRIGTIMVLLGWFYCMCCSLRLLLLGNSFVVPTKMVECAVKIYGVMYGPDTVWCCYNAVNILKHINKRHTISRQLVFCGSSIWLIFCFSSLTKLDRVITTLYCIRYHGTDDVTIFEEIVIWQKVLWRLPARMVVISCVK